MTRGLADPPSVCELPPEPESNCEPVDAFIPFCPVVFKCVVPAFDVWRPGPFLSSLDLQLSDGHGCSPVMYPVKMRWIIDDGLLISSAFSAYASLHQSVIRADTGLLAVTTYGEGAEKMRNESEMPTDHGIGIRLLSRDWFLECE